MTLRILHWFWPLCRIFCALALSGLVPGWCAEPTSNLLRSSVAHHEIQHLQIYRDPSRSWQVSDVAERYRAHHQPAAKTLNLGFTSDAVWVVFQLTRADGNSPSHWWLEVEQPLFMDVSLYEERADGTVVETSGHVPTSLRQHAFDYRMPTFELQLPDLTPKTYYLRVVTKTSMSASLVVWQPQPFVQHHAETRLIWGAVYGACLMIILFYGVWWIWSRERIHLIYALYVTVNFLASFFSAAWPRQLFPQMSEDTFLLITGFCISLAAPVATYFTFEILQLKTGPLRRVPLSVKTLSVAMCLVSMTLVGMGQYGTAMPIIQFYILNFILLSAAIAGWRALQGDRNAQLFLIAFGIFYIGIAWRFLKNIGWLEPNFWSNNAYQIGAFGHMLIMSMSVFASYSRLRHDKEQVEFRLQAESQRRQEQANFLGMVSHEFRTPLSIIATASENLLAERGISDASRSRVEKIIRANKRLSALMDEYLSYERLAADARPTGQDCVELGQLVRSVAGDMTDVEGPPVQVHSLDSVTIVGEAELLRVALHNLVINARRHSPAQGVVTVRVARRGHEAEVVVEDQGEGIDQNERAKIFDKFFRGNNALSKPGAGMGLYLVKSIVEQHGGRVEQRNLAPTGCQFVIILPAS